MVLPSGPLRHLLSRITLTLLAVCSFTVVCSRLAYAWKVSPQGTALEKSIAKKYQGWWGRTMLWVADRGVNHFTEPVHEEITQRMFGCQGQADVCGNVYMDFASPYILAGVRWNDDPPFRLQEGEARNISCKITETIRFTTQPKCWAELFRDAKRKAAEKQPLDAANRTCLLARSHFGDLQFLHAMASQDGEPAAETQKRVMMWVEFAWKVSHGDYELGTQLKDVSIEGFGQFFGSSGWRVQDLFTLGNVALRPRVAEVAFGSLLHTVEDSFAKGHVDRGEATFGATCPASSHLAPGRIREFHAYNNQDGDSHADYDSRKAFTEHWTADRPNVVEVGQVLREYYERKARWEDVKPYLECVFAVENAEAKASAGAGFKRAD